MKTSNTAESRMRALRESPHEQNDENKRD